MTTNPTNSIPVTSPITAPEGTRRSRRSHLAIRSTLALAALAALAGCQTPPPPTASNAAEQPAEITLREGDVVKVTFPGTSNLDAAPQPIRRDGKITLEIVGEVMAAGMTPTELQNKLVSLYSKDLVSKEVVVTVVSSSFSVFVDGTVLRPGKVTADHPLTAFEAIMEAGGFVYDKANTERVMVIRHQPGAKGYNYYYLDLKPVLEGQAADLFYLAPGDVVHVAQKFSWF